MTDQKILENNRLIAEFMGGKFNSQVRFRMAQNDIWLPIHGVCRYDTVEVGKGKILRYHKSWDWLMPVVEKIIEIKLPKNHSVVYDMIFETKKICLQVRKQEGNLGHPILRYYSEDEGDLSLIEHLYNSAIRFIKWYNKNK